MAKHVTSAGDDVVWHQISHASHYCGMIRDYGDDGEQHAIMSVLNLKVPRVYKGNILIRRMSNDMLVLGVVLVWRLHLWAMEADSHGYNS